MGRTNVAQGARSPSRKAAGRCHEQASRDSRGSCGEGWWLRERQDKRPMSGRTPKS